MIALMIRSDLVPLASRDLFFLFSLQCDCLTQPGDVLGEFFTISFVFRPSKLILSMFSTEYLTVHSRIQNVLMNFFKFILS